VCIVAVAEHGDIDQVRRRRILPDLGIDALQIDFLVEPTADPVIAAVSNEVREIADIFVLAAASIGVALRHSGPRLSVIAGYGGHHLGGEAFDGVNSFEYSSVVNLDFKRSSIFSRTDLADERTS
jgi:hypothetical protein